MKATRSQSRAGVTLAEEPDRSPMAVHRAAHLMYQHFGSVKQAAQNCGLGGQAMNTALYRPDCADSRTVRRVLAGARRLGHQCEPSGIGTDDEVQRAARLLYQHFGSIKEAGRNCGLGTGAMQSALRWPERAQGRTRMRVLAGARRLGAMLKAAAGMEAQRAEERRLADVDGGPEQCLRCGHPVCLGAAPVVATCLKCGRGLSVTREVVSEPVACAAKVRAFVMTRDRGGKQ
jgi:hypothetical protein